MPASRHSFLGTLLGLALTGLMACGSARPAGPVPLHGQAQLPRINALQAAGETDVDLRALMSPVKDQGERNTCNAFAATALMEFLIGRQQGQLPDLSENYAYWLGKTQTLNTEYLRETYAHIDGLAGFLAVEAYARGSMAESAWPYERQNWLQTGNPGCKQVKGEPDTACFTGQPPQHAQPLPYRLKPVYIERERIADYLLSKKTPVVFNLQWVQAAVGPQGDLRMPTQRELTQAGGHVITLVGFQPKQKRFIFRNSYGPHWGKGGYGTLPEAYLLQHCEVCPYLASAAGMAPEVRDFVHKASMGVSGELVTR